MNLSPLLLVVLLAMLSFGLCVGAMALRRSQGLAPLMLVVGMLEGVKYHVAAWLWIDMPGGGAVTAGSLVSYINLLAVMLVVHLSAGLAAARVMAWGVIALGLMLGLLHGLYLVLAEQPGVGLRVLTQVDHWASGLRIQSVGNALLLLAFGPDSLSAPSLIANALGKGGMALFFALLAWGVLRESGGAGLPMRVQGRVRALLGAYTFRRNRLEALERELQTDPLTGVFNRRFLDATVPDILRLDQRRGDPSGLLLLDIDRFKALNDEHGHLVGDEALRHVAQLLQQTLRQHDCVIRYGGEEFLLLLPGAGAPAARALAEQVLAQLAGQPLPLPDGRTLTLGATIGVAVSPADGRTWQALLARADERMYAGKRSGRGRVVVA
jgi:diguanylate cyclase (GGDEF)-like protein